MVSEISTVPAGFILYRDLPLGHQPPGTEITNFAQCDYNDTATITMELNVYENNTWLPADFRTKEDIKTTIEKNRKWVEEHEQY